MKLRLILTMLVCGLLSAQLPVPLMSKRGGLVRSGLEMGVQTGQVNLLKYSEALDNAAWSGTLVAATDGTTPSGLPAYSLTEPSSGTGAVKAQTSVLRVNTQYTATLLYKGGTQATSIIIGDLSNVYWYASLNTSTMAITPAGSVAGTTASMTALTDGWYRIVITGTTGGNVGSFGFGVIGAVSPGEYFYLGPIQLNEGPTALPYVATTDLQSIASLPPGTATLVRGANTGASTDDPTVSALGWTLDSGDRVSGLPAKGAAWTTTNCSGVECYTVDNSVDGEMRRNLLLWSEDLSNAVWGKNASTVTANDRVAPDGTSTADKVVGDVSAASFVAQMVTVGAIASKTYTAYGYVFSESDANITVRMRGTGATQEAESFEFVVPANTWTRVDAVKSFTAAADGTQIYVMYFCGRYTVDTNKTVWWWGHTLNEGSTATPYQKTTVATGREYINGERRRNLLLWSEDLSNAAWGGGAGATVEPNVIVAPDGTTTADIITYADNSVDGHYRQSSIPVTPGIPTTLSAYIKVASGTRITNLQYYCAAGNVGAASNTATTQWQRFSVTFTSTAATTCNVYYYVSGATGYAIHVWGAMVNPGSTALPYQKTTDSREWALETVGNYVGPLTYWQRYSRALGAGEVARNFRTWLRPLINSKGGLIP